EVIMREPLIAPHYQVVIERENALDKMTVLVEAAKQLPNDYREALERKLQRDLRETIIISPAVKIVDPGTLPRFEGKPKVVVDKRSI
ncbi:MAG: hypothetical protein N3D82_06105, partial [Ignisphaera sp.]|nr:hypothetical protein [Ignisphaera sp.]MDW8086262.1 hypothetical protein [Ignisphaera sp.]